MQPLDDCCWDYRDFASTLFQAYRVVNIIKSLGVFCKSLTPQDRGKTRTSFLGSADAASGSLCVICLG
jgi:hypothetical protein